MHVPDLAGLYLEDSYVLAISETPRRLSFMLDAVLTPAHPRYRAPLPGEQHCYATGVLIFEGITTIEWIRRSPLRSVDAAGNVDVGNIDSLTVDGASWRIEGDWGQVRLLSTSTPSFVNTGGHA